MNESSDWWAENAMLLIIILHIPTILPFCMYNDKPHRNTNHIYLPRFDENQLRTWNGSSFHPFEGKLFSFLPCICSH